MKKSAEEIIQILNTLGVDGYEFEDNEFDGDLGETKCVKRVGGHEGGGEYTERVVHFIDHDVYIRLTGCYYSYNGTEWNGDFTEVSPKEKTIIVYEPVN